MLLPVLLCTLRAAIAETNAIVAFVSLVHEGESTRLRPHETALIDGSVLEALTLNVSSPGIPYSYSVRLLTPAWFWRQPTIIAAGTAAGDAPLNLHIDGFMAPAPFCVLEVQILRQGALPMHTFPWIHMEFNMNFNEHFDHVEGTVTAPACGPLCTCMYCYFTP